MNQHNSFDEFGFKGLALLSVVDISENQQSLADLVSHLPMDCAIGFDRSVWSFISSGQLPSQLFPFRQFQCKNAPQALEDVIVMFVNDETEIEPLLNQNYIELLSYSAIDQTLLCSGGLGESFEDEDLSGGVGGMLVEWDGVNGKELPQTPLLKNLWLRGDHFFQLAIGHNVVHADDLLEDVLGVYAKPRDFALQNNALKGLFFYMPSEKLLSELGERVRDKEKVHLDKEIRGAHI